MLSSTPMKQIDILVLEKHVDNIMAEIGFSETLEIIEKPISDDQYFTSSDKMHSIAALKEKMNDLLLDIDLSFSYAECQKTKEFVINTKEIQEKFDELFGEIGPIISNYKDVEKQKRELEKIYVELSEFGYIDINLSKLAEFDFTYIVYGTIPKNKIKILEKEVANRALIIPIGTKGDVICIASKKGKWALESSLKKIDFNRKELEEYKDKSIKTLVDETEKKLSSVNDDHKALKSKIETFKKQNYSLLLKLYVSLNVEEDVTNTLRKFNKTDKIYHVSGWIEAAKLDEAINTVKNITDGKFYLEIKEPYEVKGYKDGKIKVPVKLKKRKLLSNFEILVINYGLPNYGEVDPTIFVATTFLIMFGLMFGDIGQGFVFFLLGILMKIKPIKFLNKFRHMGILFIAMGLSSMTFGYLYGTIFGNEHLIKPLLFSPLKDFMKLFVIAVAFGALFLSIGIIINIINELKKKKYFEAFFEKTGIFGLWFYWGALALTVKVLVFKGNFSFKQIDVYLLLITPVFLLFLKSPVHLIIEKKKGHSKEGLVSVILESLIETIELFTYYLGNTASFLRLGALSLAHSSLSFAVYKMASIIQGSTVGNIFGIVIIVIGNIFIIALEGLVASIQTMRLEYYEFFSKFFSGEGKTFNPFKIDKSKKVYKY